MVYCGFKRQKTINDDGFLVLAKRVNESLGLAAQ